MWGSGSGRCRFRTWPLRQQPSSFPFVLLHLWGSQLFICKRAINSDLLGLSVV